MAPLFNVEPVVQRATDRLPPLDARRGSDSLCVEMLRLIDKILRASDESSSPGSSSVTVRASVLARWIWPLFSLAMAIVAAYMLARDVTELKECDLSCGSRYSEALCASATFGDRTACTIATQGTVAGIARWRVFAFVASFWPIFATARASVAATTALVSACVSGDSAQFVIFGTKRQCVALVAAGVWFALWFPTSKVARAWAERAVAWNEIERRDVWTREFVTVDYYVWRALLIYVLFRMCSLVAAIVGRALSLVFHSESHFQRLKTYMDHERVIQTLTQPCRVPDAVELDMGDDLGGELVLAGFECAHWASLIFVTRLARDRYLDCDDRRERIATHNEVADLAQSVQHKLATVIARRYIPPVELALRGDDRSDASESDDAGVAPSSVSSHAAEGRPALGGAAEDCAEVAMGVKGTVHRRAIVQRVLECAHEHVHRDWDGYYEALEERAEDGHLPISRTRPASLPKCHTHTDVRRDDDGCQKPRGTRRISRTIARWWTQLRQMGLFLLLSSGIVTTGGVSDPILAHRGIDRLHAVLSHRSRHGGGGGGDVDGAGGGDVGGGAGAVAAAAASGDGDGGDEDQDGRDRCERVRGLVPEKSGSGGIMLGRRTRLHTWKLGYYLFWNLRDPSRALPGLSRTDVDAVARRLGMSAHTAWNLMDHDGDRRVTMNEVVRSVETVYNDRKVLAKSLEESESVVGQVQRIIHVVLVVLLAFLAVAIVSPDNIGRVWTSMSAVVLSFSFVFGNSICEVFENCVFLFFTHPFDLGDKIRWNGETYFVRGITLNYVNLLHSTGSYVNVSSHALKNVAITNVTRSQRVWESVHFASDINTTVEQCEVAADKVVEAIATHPRLFGGMYRVWLSDTDSANKVQVSAHFDLKTNGMDAAMVGEAMTVMTAAFADGLCEAGVSYTDLALACPTCWPKRSRAREAASRGSVSLSPAPSNVSRSRASP